VKSALAIAALFLTLAAPAAGVNGPGVVNFPNADLTPVGDPAAHGYVSPAISTHGSPSFCWELSLWTSAQPLFVYLRRAGTGRVVTRIDVRDNHTPTQPWQGSGGYSGCATIPRTDERAFLRRPSLYYLDVRTQTALHAARARLRGPRL
jgi:hypothetical protein